MKLVLLGLVFVVICIVLFALGAVSPGRSKQLQRRVDSASGKGERKGDEKAGRFGDATRRTLEKMRRGADRSAEKGRDVNRRVTED